MTVKSWFCINHWYVPIILTSDTFLSICKASQASILIYLPLTHLSRDILLLLLYFIYFPSCFTHCPTPYFPTYLYKCLIEFSPVFQTSPCEIIAYSTKQFPCFQKILLFAICDYY